VALKEGAPEERNLVEYDVIVVGAGIVGSMIARELSKFEGRIVLFDKEPFPGFGVTKAGVSLIHSPLMCPPGTLKGKLCINAPVRHKRLAGELNVGFREVDELFLALEPSQMANLEALRKRGEANGIKGCQIIGPEKIRELEPYVTEKAIAALYVRGLLGIHPPEWAFALTENARGNGVLVHLSTRVTDITKERDFAYIVQTEKGSFKTRYLINAAGLSADEIARMVGDRDIELKLTKGTMAILDKTASHLVRHTVYGTFSGTHSQLITPTAHGNLMIGLGYFSTPAHKLDTSVTQEKLLEIIRMGKELVPALPEKDIISTFAGIRSENNKAANGDFYIAHSQNAPGVIHAIIGSPGLTAAPAISELVIKMLHEAGLDMVEKRSFQRERRGWLRFSAAPFETQEGLVASNPEYGRIVCRCEHVTAAEIVEAIRRGAHTLDGIKHLTRAGMGRCQGGFCGMAVLNLLARQLGVGHDQVTKKGRGSYPIMGFTRTGCRVEKDFENSHLRGIGSGRETMIPLE
jgi:glycerol-3-phosphate dehydrogenase